MKTLLTTFFLALLCAQAPCHAAEVHKPAVSDRTHAENTKVIGESPAEEMGEHMSHSGQSSESAAAETSSPMDAMDEGSTNAAADRVLKS